MKTLQWDSKQLHVSTTATNRAAANQTNVVGAMTHAKVCDCKHTCKQKQQKNRKIKNAIATTTSTASLSKTALQSTAS